jgi:hypothetical protein
LLQPSNREPLILVDGSDLKADQSLHLLRAWLPVGGRSHAGG